MPLHAPDLLLSRPGFLGGPMACRFGFIVTTLALLLAAPIARAQSGGEVSGIWLTQAGDAKVRVSKCSGGIFGVVIWLKDPINPATGKPQGDDKNPNPALARRPMLRLPLFTRLPPPRPHTCPGPLHHPHHRP